MDIQTTSAVPGANAMARLGPESRTIGASTNHAGGNAGGDARIRSEAGVDAQHSAAIEPHRLDAAVQTVAEKLPVGANELEFSVDEESGKTIIRVIDPETGEIIRQLPPDEVLELAEALGALEQSKGRPAAGLLLDSEA